MNKMSFKQKFNNVFCAVQTCKASKQTHPNREFYLFPSDQILCDVWMERCELKKTSLTKYLKVCEKHFRPNGNGKTTLLKNSVPEYYLNNPYIKCENETQSIFQTIKTLYDSLQKPENNKLSKTISVNIKDAKGANSTSKNRYLSLKNRLAKKRIIANRNAMQNLTNKLNRFAKIIKFYKQQISFLKNELRKYRINKSVNMQIDSLPNLSPAAMGFGKILNDSTKDWPCTKCREHINVAVLQLNEVDINSDDMINLEKTNPSEEPISSFELGDDKNSKDNTDLEESSIDLDSIGTMNHENDDEDQEPVEQTIAIASAASVKYVCEKCEVKKPTYKQLLHHMRQHKDIHLYECERCGKEFKQRSRYLTHTRVYQLDKTFICKICSKGFKTITHLRQHELTHKTEKTHPCPNCDKIYCHMKGLKSHLMSHKEKHLLCINCNKKFQYNSQLKIHMALVHSLGVIKGNDDTSKVVKLQKQFTCEICGKLFVSEIYLKFHIKNIHNNEKPFPCSYCSKSFRSSEALTCHMQHHINSKNTSMDPKTMQSYSKYKCDECDKWFTSSHFLKNHKIIHSGLKEHICAHCGNGFAFKWYLERHVRLVHDIAHPKNIVCGICRKVAANTHALKSHMLSHTGESPFHCKFCDSKFRYEKSLRLHIKNKHESKNI